MPTYKNSGTTLAYVQGQRLEVGEKISTNQWFTSLPAGVTLTAETPFHNPIVYSAKVTGAGSYAIPATILGNYKITFTVASGDATVKLSSSNGIARVLVAGEQWIVTCMSRIVDSVIWTVSSGVASVTVELI